MIGRAGCKGVVFNGLQVERSALFHAACFYEGRLQALPAQHGDSALSGSFLAESGLDVHPSCSNLATLPACCSF